MCLLIGTRVYSEVDARERQRGDPRLVHTLPGVRVDSSKTYTSFNVDGDKLQGLCAGRSNYCQAEHNRRQREKQHHVRFLHYAVSILT